MWTSVPQIAVFLTLISTSLGPISGTGTSSIQMPGSALAFTSAFIMFDILLSLESLDPESLLAAQEMTPSSFPTVANAATARSMSALE